MVLYKLLYQISSGLDDRIQFVSDTDTFTTCLLLWNGCIILDRDLRAAWNGIDWNELRLCYDAWLMRHEILNEFSKLSDNVNNKYVCYPKHKTVFQVSILSIVFVALYSSSLKIDFYSTGICNKHSKWVYHRKYFRITTYSNNTFSRFLWLNWLYLM